MSTPTSTASIGFGVANATDFVLDSATRGVLDGTTYLLATGMNNVTTSVLSASIRRGQSSLLFNTIDAGSVSVTLLNFDRSFDPDYLSSPYVAGLVPGRRIEIKTNGYTIATGKVEDWNLDYEVDGYSTATALATDAIGLLGRSEMSEWTATAGQTPGARIIDILDRAEVSWVDAERDIDVGVAVLQADVVSDGSNALNYAQAVALSELGYLYATKDGVLRYRPRVATANQASSATFGDGGIAFSGIQRQIGSEALAGRVSVSRVDGTPQVATIADPSSFVAAYGAIPSLSLGGLLFNTDEQALNLANYLLGVLSEPATRVTSIAVNLLALSSSQQATVLSLDISDVVTVAFTPNQISPSVSQEVVIQGIDHAIGASSHNVTFHFVPASERRVFQLDSSSYGVLDTNRLAF